MEVADSIKVKGKEERLFSVKKGNLQISDTEIVNTSPENHVRYFSFFLGNFLQQATSYLMNTLPEQYKDEEFAYWHTHLSLTDDEFQELIHSITKCVQEVAANDPILECSTCTFAGMFIPKI